jgi:hypothetical protein
MARFKNYLLVLVGFVVAGAIGAAFGTGTAQAVVSTLVSVVNPGTSPVHTSSVDDAGRVAYQSTINNTGKCSGSGCSFPFPVVPTGHRVVIQHVSGLLQLNAVPTNIAVNFFETAGVGLTAEFLAPPSTISAFDHPLLFYVDSGTSVQVQVSIFSNNGATFVGGNAFQFVTLTGYELDCTVAACSPIATQ